MRLRPAGLALLAVLVAVFLVGLVRTAWISDDGFIALRTVENTVAGHGMRWNVVERTQTFTPPLWQLVLTAVRFVAGESYYSTLLISSLLSVAAVVLLVVGTASLAPAALVVASALASSRAFVEYSTSGLEPPLAFALVAGFTVAWFREGDDPELRLGRLSILAGLITLTRYDLALLVAPALLVATRGVPRGRVVRAALLGAAPLAAWMAFAWLYYGSPFPQTAFAKAFSPNIPQGELAREAGRYVANLLAWDPVTAVGLAAGLVVGLTRKLPRTLPIALGLVLYGAYLIRIGGDFMSGRFFAVPLVCAVAILARIPLTTRVALVPALALFGVALLGRTPPWASPTDYGAELPSQARISDERLLYYARFGLFSPTRVRTPPNELSDGLREQDGIKLPAIMLYGAVGHPGYVGGPLLHIVDYWLCDPLLARLPKSAHAAWKVGHYARRIPEGWLETVATGENRVRHDGLRPLVEDLLLVTRGELLSGARLAAIVRLSTGAHADGVARFVAEEYDSPPVLELPREGLDAMPPVGTPWWKPPMRVIYAGGLSLTPDGPLHSQRLEAAVDCGDEYEFAFFLGDDPVGRAVVATEPIVFRGAQHVRFDVPEPARTRGFDRVRISGGNSIDQIYAIGALRPAL